MSHEEDKSIRDTDKLVKDTPRAGQGPRTEDGESIRDINPIVSAEVKPEKKYTEDPERNTEDHEYCLVCQTLMPLNGECPECGWTRKQIKEIAWDKFHATGASGF